MENAAALDDRDAAAVLEVIGSVTDARTVDEYADLAMKGLFELIECIDVSYNEMNRVESRVAWKSLPDQGELMAEFAPIFERYMRQNPLVAHFEDTGDTRAMMWSDFASLEEMRATDVHREMFAHLGVDSQMAMTLPAPHGIIIGFAVNTGPAGFTERDRAVMNALRPHLAHAYRSIQLRDELSVARQALEARGWSSALVDADGAVEAVTEGASEALGEIGIELREGELLPHLLRDVFVRGVAGYHPSQPAVASSPVRLSEEADGVAGSYVPSPLGPHVVMVRARVDAARRALKERGLSPREIDVALALTDGGTNAGIGRRLGIAEGTVRKHLESIYRRLDVDDRASAVARIHGL